MNKKAIMFIAQGAYSGRFPIAPGTAGTVVGVAIYLALKGLAPVLYGAVLILLFLLGTWAATRAEKLLGSKDHSSIVIDEVVGYLVSMFLLPLGWGFVVAGFLLFRIFDILKPWPLNGLQKIPGGLGVMLDDVGAGIYANILLQIYVALMKLQ